MTLPRLYPIIDFSCFVAQTDPISAVARFAEELVGAGATLIQLRDKSQPDFENFRFEKSVTRRFLSCARELRRATLDRATLIINDRVDICLAADADGVHLGQDDLSPLAARKIFDSVISHAPGTSTPWVPHPFAANPHNSSEIAGERVGGNASVARVPHPFAAESPASSKLQSERVGGKKLLIGFSTHNLAQVIEADALPVDYIAIGPVFAT